MNYNMEGKAQIDYQSLANSIKRICVCIYVVCVFVNTCTEYKGFFVHTQTVYSNERNN